MDYFKKGTAVSPAIIMDSKTKSALITGNFLFSNNTERYSKIIEKVKSRLANTQYTSINIKLNVFDTKAAKSLMEIFSIIKKTNHENLAIRWICDVKDKEMMEMGRDYSELFDLNIDIAAN